ncbi:unnamed protein product [Prunus armeniaca]|uniref:Uncharacterized protein n=1 Tax=Prunus armeniaca TaxID=36596 RepID=A0A6J5Y2G9_PRUAR|nr:unnamed protein product [Prunus armeniaca]
MEVFDTASEQQLQVEQQLSEVLREAEVKRGAQPPFMRETNVFAVHNLAKVHKVLSQPAPSSQSPFTPAPRSQAPSQPAQSSLAHQGSSSQPQPMVTSPKRPRLKSPAKRIRPWRV